GVLTNNGLISSSANLSFTSVNSPFTLNGIGTITANSSSASSILVNTNGAFAINLNGAQAITAGSTGGVTFASQSAGGSVTFGNGVSYTVAGAGPVKINTQTLTFGAGSSLAALGASSITLNNGTSGANMIIYTPDNASATISSVGGSININPTAALTFSQA